MKKLIYVVVLALVFPFLCANAAPLYYPDKRLAPLDDPLKAVFVVKDQRVDKQKIKSAIVLGAAARYWKVTGETEGHITLSTSVRGKHLINLDVSYDDSSFQLLYLNSANLMYQEDQGQKLIHRSYNKWIRELATAISNVVGVPTVVTVGK